MKDKITDKEMKMVLDGARTKIIAINKGMAVEGNLLEVVKEETKEEKNTKVKEEEELKKIMKDLVEALTKDLENMLGYVRR